MASPATGLGHGFFGAGQRRGQQVFENIDQARLQGVEVEARAALPAGWQLRLNYTCLDACDGNGQRLQKRPRHQVGAQVDGTARRWRAVLRADHRADQLISPVVVGQPLKPLPATTRVSAQVARCLAMGLALRLGVDDLDPLEPAHESPLFTWAEAPRTWRVTLRCGFLNAERARNEPGPQPPHGRRQRGGGIMTTCR